MNTENRKRRGQKARLSISNSACVEVAAEGNEILVWDSKDPDIQALQFTQEEWAAFLHGVKKGEFDHFVQPGVLEGLLAATK